MWFTFDPGAIAIDTLEKFSFLKGEILYKISTSILINALKKIKPPVTSEK